ncbi:Cytochrome P450 oxidoreductase OrdA-like protein [Rasamsonia emersonii CBS 393.64]|uniref:Cytochrome P450 oxidoreductase OrdA-like protein n=1 Tax=Rasamsonia emersonii (strain ATCC 16479 / CBS 393.64 / IMI 116815) TaxID=1408163 RepID=A0A0F4YUI0_RASE3|nr:Cytochrome P450 oxidoreductase OrdA-like protein [Rasamsonia emersonii CBS 393.64]KKA21750.1 Cytochrome P450 oxidoreductase OrdA-like protein [Rasamsonia emersonii CBS 393.64]
MATLSPVLSILLVSLVSYLVKVLLLSKRRGPPLPPGPKPKPLVGNISDLPQKGKPEWLHWLRHKDLYGPISSVTVLGQTLIILNDSNLAFELMEKRSSKHSSRPRLVFSGEMEAGAIMLKLAYNYTVEPHKNDPLIDLADTALDLFSRSAATGAYLVDVIPALKHIPEWFPGAGFKRKAKEWRKVFIDLAERPYAFVKQQMKQGINEPSYVSQLLEQGNLDEEEEFVIKWSSASLYGGAADTTVSSLSCFFLAMMLHPEVQRKAQEEIDRVVGTERLPGVADREKLPYIDAIVKEVLRWNPVAPMGLPHMTTEDDVCEGYLIPKGALLLPNIWGFLHDPKSYHDPMTFKPERFLEQDGHPPEPDPHSLAFGFGRRICPGRLLADTSLYLSIALSLAVFNIGKPLDENGKEVEPVVEMQPGVISHPAPFQTRITPRSPQHEKLVRAVEVEHPWKKSDAEVLQNITY